MNTKINLKEIKRRIECLPKSNHSQLKEYTKILVDISSLKTNADIKQAIGLLKRHDSEFMMRVITIKSRFDYIFAILAKGKENVQILPENLTKKEEEDLLAQSVKEFEIRFGKNMATCYKKYLTISSSSTGQDTFYIFVENIIKEVSNKNHVPTTGKRHQ
jgi:hypothetical protein